MSIFRRFWGWLFPRTLPPIKRPIEPPANVTTLPTWEEHGPSPSGRTKAWKAATPAERVLLEAKWAIEDKLAATKKAKQAPPPAA